MLQDAIGAGLAIGPHLLVARPITHTGGHCWYMGGEADTEEDIRRVARENLRVGADLLKIMATGAAREMYQGQVMAGLLDGERHLTASMQPVSTMQWI